MEAWKDIPGFEGLYQASNTGLIRTSPGKTTSNRKYAKRVWQVRVLRHKYKVNKKRRDAAVTLWKDGKCNDYLVSRLVASAWVPGWAKNMTVNHIDGNPMNNNASNLEWVTLEENIKKAFSEGLYQKVQQPVVLGGDETNMHFSSMSEASRAIGRNIGYVSACVKKGITANGTDGKSYCVQLLKR